MSTDVINPAEVILNSVRYPLVGQMQPLLLSRFPEKTVDGDYTLDSDPDLSIWAMSDHRGGMLVEEGDEVVDKKRYYWGLCNASYKGSITLPRLATPISSVTATAASWLSPTTATATGGWTDLPYIYDSATGTAAYSDNLAYGTWSSTVTITRSTTVPACSKVRFWCDVANATTEEINLDVYYQGAWHDIYNGTFTALAWVEKSLGGTYAVTQARIALKNTHVDQQRGYIHDFDFYDNAPAVGAPTRHGYTNFNGKAYIALGQYLTKVATGAGASLTMIAHFPATISTLVTYGSNLFIFLDDDHYYWYMNTSEICTLGGALGGTLAKQHDGKLFKMTTAGVCTYSINPENASPTWTTAGNLPDVASGDPQTLFVGFDADGNDTLYCATKKGLYINDLTHALWLLSALSFDHPNGGKGAIRWRDAVYVSAGLGVQRYIAGTTATIESMGLDRDDTLPAAYNGEIVNFIGKNNTALIAIVDSTQSGGTSTSSLCAYDGKGWQTWWVGDSTEKAMYGGVISSAYGYRLWFDHNSTIYYIDIPRGLEKPKKLSTFAYGASGNLYTYWFDGNWPVGQKMARRLRVKSLGCSATGESITVSYKLNHTVTDTATGWTALGSAITSDTLTTFEFPNSTTPAGTLFYAIQFKYALARRAGTTTYSPEILYYLLEYEKVIAPRWGWQMVLDCSKPWHDKSPEQLLDALVTAAELQTLATFVYKSTTKYVRVASVTGSRLTGSAPKGTYTIVLRER